MSCHERHEQIRSALTPAPPVPSLKGSVTARGCGEGLAPVLVRDLLSPGGMESPDRHRQEARHHHMTGWHCLTP